MTTYFADDGQTVELYANEGMTDLITSADSPDTYSTDYLKQIHAEHISNQSVPDELAFAEAIQQLADVAAGDYQRPDGQS